MVLALARDRVGGLRGGRHDHEVDLVVVDEVRRHLRRPVRIGLAVLGEDSDGPRLPGDGEPLVERLPDPADDEVVGLAERGQ
jgi:hypothetical protein